MAEQNIASFAAQIETDMSDNAVQERTRSQDRFWTIYSTLRERIALLEYSPGAKLSEGDLASEFGVSRTPLRRALSRLEAEGLVDSRHGVGTFVTILDIHELREVYRLRRELAPLLSVLSPNEPTSGIINKMRSVRVDCEKIKTSSRPKQAFAKMNIAFFRVLMQLVGNRALKEIMERLFYRTARMWPALTTEDEIVAEADVFIDEIDETIRTLEAGDVDAAAHVRRAHISLAFNRLEKYLDQKSASN